MMTQEEIIALLLDQQEKMDNNTIDADDPDYKYYRGMSAMVDFLLMRINEG